MNSNMLIVLSLVAAALCAPQVPKKFEEIEAFRHEWSEQMEYKEGGDAGIAERNNEQFAEGLFYKEFIMNLYLFLLRLFSQRN